MKKYFKKNLVMTEEEEYYFSKVIVGSVKNLLIMTIKKLEILVM